MPLVSIGHYINAYIRKEAYFCLQLASKFLRELAGRIIIYSPSASAQAHRTCVVLVCVQIRAIAAVCMGHSHHRLLLFPSFVLPIFVLLSFVLLLRAPSGLVLPALPTPWTFRLSYGKGLKRLFFLLHDEYRDKVPRALSMID